MSGTSTQLGSTLKDSGAAPRTPAMAQLAARSEAAASAPRRQWAILEDQNHDDDEQGDDQRSRPDVDPSFEATGEGLQGRARASLAGGIPCHVVAVRAASRGERKGDERRPAGERGLRRRP